ncbi:sporulation initiation phosphotransferase F [Clostridium puniceum]|uniref:Stage 0 sporulation protein A homolog n=1 Tax=Clostridium puniceum TaxID=29367 RepID=A0A1S8TJI8_9CLOT|nr:response regulator [Clostridium puniceum]OOM77752.1 sporulation initiation phosphotransferase F [Clostridium puniceum]
MSYSHSVLFVDDQEDLLILINRILKDEHYTKFFAKNSKEALEIIEKEAIDIIVTDMLMPDIGGLQLLEILKSKYPNIVRIVLSGYSQVPFIVEAINKGDIFRYIMKPWKINDSGKMIIRDAIEYSDYIKRNGTYSNKNSSISFTEDNIKNILSYYDKDFFITIDNKVILKSDINNLALDELIDDDIYFYYNKHDVNTNICLYIKK